MAAKLGMSALFQHLQRLDLRAPDADEEAAFQASMLRSTWAEFSFCALYSAVVATRSFPLLANEMRSQKGLLFVAIDLRWIYFIVDWAVAAVLWLVLLASVARQRMRCLQKLNFEFIWLAFVFAALQIQCLASSVNVELLSGEHAEDVWSFDMRWASTESFFSTQVLALASVLLLGFRSRIAWIVPSFSCLTALVLAGVASVQDSCAFSLPALVVETVALTVLCCKGAWHFEQAQRLMWHAEHSIKELPQRETRESLAEVIPKKSALVKHHPGTLLRRAGCRVVLQLAIDFQIAAANDQAEDFFKQQVEGFHLEELVSLPDRPKLLATLHGLAEDGGHKIMDLGLLVGPARKVVRRSIIVAFDNAQPPDYLVGLMEEAAPGSPEDSGATSLQRGNMNRQTSGGSANRRSSPQGRPVSNLALVPEAFSGKVSKVQRPRVSKQDSADGMIRQISQELAKTLSPQRQAGSSNGDGRASPTLPGQVGKTHSEPIVSVRRKEVLQEDPFITPRARTDFDKARVNPIPEDQVVSMSLSETPLRKDKRRASDSDIFRGISNLDLMPRALSGSSSISLTYSITNTRSLPAGFKDAETETEIVWEKQGWKCKNCAKPPLLPGTPRTGPPARLGRRMGRTKDSGMNGRWVLFPEFVPLAFPWLHYLHIAGHLAIDGNGKKWRLKMGADNKPVLAGGALTVDAKIGVLHRDGRSGVRLTYGHLSEPVQTSGSSSSSSEELAGLPGSGSNVQTFEGVQASGRPLVQAPVSLSSGDVSDAQGRQSDMSDEDEQDLLQALGLPSRTQTAESDMNESVCGDR